MDLSPLKKVKQFIKNKNKDLSKIDIFISLTGYLRKDKKNNFSDYENILNHIKANIYPINFLKLFVTKNEKEKIWSSFAVLKHSIKFGGSPYTVF